MKKLLIVVDYQNDFVDGTLGFQKAKEIEDNIVNKIKEYEKEDILFTFDTHQENYLETQEGKKLPVRHCIFGTRGHDLYGKVKDFSKGRILINKVTFGSVELVDYLKNNNYDLIELCGVVTDICVLANAIIAKATLPECEIVVDAKCVASNDDNKEKAAFEVMNSQQIKVLNR